jgi:hypothetical protein
VSHLSGFFSEGVGVGKAEGRDASWGPLASVMRRSYVPPFNARNLSSVGVGARFGYSGEHWG